jgi:hypothetical protein
VTRRDEQRRPGGLHAPVRGIVFVILLTAALVAAAAVLALVALQVVEVRV